jgi:4-carboxymuconolactone decarboxylase
MFRQAGQPRIYPLPPDARSASAQEVLDTLGGEGGDSNVYTTLIRAEGLTRRWLPFIGKLMSKGKIPARHRELLILRTAWNCQAEYEWAHHVWRGLAAGLTEEEVDRIPTGPSANWSSADASLLRAADELHRESCISDDTWAALEELYDEQQLIELPMLVGHYHMVAMTLNSLGVQIESAGCPAFRNEQPS